MAMISGQDQAVGGTRWSAAAGPHFQSSNGELWKMAPCKGASLTYPFAAACQTDPLSQCGRVALAPLLVRNASAAGMARTQSRHRRRPIRDDNPAGLCELVQHQRPSLPDNSGNRCLIRPGLQADRAWRLAPVHVLTGARTRPLRRDMLGRSLENRRVSENCLPKSPTGIGVPCPPPGHNRR